MKFSFIINPNSGKDRKKTALTDILNRYKKDSISVMFTEYPGHAVELVWKSIREGATTIVAAGGDGTINEIGTQLVGKDIRLGIIPMGSGNGYARSLKIPVKLEKALDLIFSGKAKAVDVGTLNDQFFFAVAGVGLDASIGLKFNTHHTRGALPYFYLGIKSFFDYKYPEFILNSKEHNMSIRPTLITIANSSQFGNGAMIAPQADIQDGMLDICILERMKTSRALASLLNLFNGKIQKVKAYSSFKTDALEISAKSSDLIYHIDGEPHITKNKIQIGIMEKSIQVICPEQD